jgi:hypothetical protein
MIQKSPSDPTAENDIMLLSEAVRAVLPERGGK